METFEVGHLGGIACLDQSFEARLDELHRATAEHCLLSEKVGLGLLPKIRLNNARLTPTDGAGIGQCNVAGMARLVLVDGDQARNPATLGVGLANGVAGGLRGNHDDIEVGPRGDLAVMHVKAVGKGQGGTLLDDRCDVCRIDRGNGLVGHEQHDQVCAFDRSTNLGNLQPSLLDLGPGWPTFSNTDHDIDTAVVEVLGMGMALRAIADDGNLLALEQRQVTVFVVKHFHFISFQTRSTRSPRAIPELPVRTVSRMVPSSRASMKASSLLPSPVSSMV